VVRAAQPPEVDLSIPRQAVSRNMFSQWIPVARLPVRHVPGMSCIYSASARP